MSKSAVQTIIDVLGNDKRVPDDLMQLLNDFLAIERNQIAAAWLNGNNRGWSMETDWPEDGFLYYDQTYKNREQ